MSQMFYFLGIPSIESKIYGYRTYGIYLLCLMTTVFPHRLISLSYGIGDPSFIFCRPNSSARAPRVAVFNLQKFLAIVLMADTQKLLYKTRDGAHANRFTQKKPGITYFFKVQPIKRIKAYTLQKICKMDRSEVIRMH